MARRGHRVHFISYDVPRRLDRFRENVFYHEAEVYEYPLFTHPPYPIALASKIVEVATYEKLDLLHVHYAVPHATSAYLARQVLGTDAPKILTTLHGTDITLVGNNRSYLPITRFSITQSDGVTVPSQYLKHATYDKINVSTSFPIEVIPNFVDTKVFCPAPPGNLDFEALLGACSCTAGSRIITHVSNFRPVKRLRDIVSAFSQIRQHMPAKLILIGDGPDRSQTERQVWDLSLQNDVCFLGKQDDFVKFLQVSDLFMLPSEGEGFGLGALEAMSCGVPVIATNIQGLPEVVTHGETGFLSPVGDIEDMVKNSLRLLEDQQLHKKFGEACRKRVLDNFGLDKIIDQYEACYFRVLGEN